MREDRGFTLIELLVTLAIMALLVLFLARVFSSAASIASAGNKRMDADAQSRPLLDRMAIDFAKIVKRAELDYFIKSPVNPQIGNDQIAFFTEVPGYYPAAGSQSPISLIGYRVNSTGGSAAFNKMERLGKGLVWNGVSASDTPMIFLPLTISASWPSATNASSDPDYEVVGPQVFRFEYYYLLQSGTLTNIPWDTAAGHTGINGMQDVAAIVAAIAVIDSKSKVLLSDSQIGTIIGSLSDFNLGMQPGDLVRQWQNSLNSISGMPREAISQIRISQRYFPLTPRF
jgi:prepilin-type N-terminal cleavage/methylation domain-containing protein